MVDQTIRHHSPARDPCPEPAPVKPILTALFFSICVNYRYSMRAPRTRFGGTHILPKSGHLVSAGRHLCSKTSYFTVGALIFSSKSKNYPTLAQNAWFQLCRKARYLQWVRSCFDKCAPLSRILAILDQFRNHPIFTVGALSVVRNPHK